MAELIRQWKISDGFTDTDTELYEGVEQEDMPGLKNRAARWSFNRDLMESENNAISGYLSMLQRDEIVTPQYYPRIELKLASSGLVLLTFGMGTRRLGVVSYNTALEQQVVVEKITVNSSFPMPRNFSRN